MRATGVDVSHYHPILDWGALLETDISFVGIKATEGRRHVDQWLPAHRDGARAHADRLALVIYYHFADASHDPLIQAGNILAAVGELQPNERLALDVEGDNPPDIAWIESFYRNLTDMDAGVDLWVPRYKSGWIEPVVPAPWSQWTIWQWSENGGLPGIDGPCDLNYFRGDAEELRAYAAAPPRHICYTSDRIWRSIGNPSWSRAAAPPPP